MITDTRNLVYVRLPRYWATSEDGRSMMEFLNKVRNDAWDFDTTCANGTNSLIFADREDAIAFRLKFRL